MVVNIVAEAEVGMTCIAARCSRGVDTAGEILHLVDDVLESYFSSCVWVWPIPAVT